MFHSTNLAVPLVAANFNVKAAPKSVWHLIFAPTAPAAAVSVYAAAVAPHTTYVRAAEPVPMVVFEPIVLAVTVVTVE